MCDGILKVYGIDVIYWVEYGSVFIYDVALKKKDDQSHEGPISIILCFDMVSK